MNNEIKEILEDIKRIQKSDYDKLLDYITNLQEENERLNKKSEILEENNKLLIQQKQQMYGDLDIVYERIDKAIEYVKSKKAIINTDYIRIFDLFKIDEQGYTDELLKILQGSDKE